MESSPRLPYEYQFVGKPGSRANGDMRRKIASLSAKNHLTSCSFLSGVALFSFPIWTELLYFPLPRSACSRALAELQAVEKLGLSTP
jgi:hypothetical protein